MIGGCKHRLSDNHKKWVKLHMLMYSESDTSNGLWGLFTIGDEVGVEHMSELKIRIETDEYIYEEYVEA